MVLPQEEVGDIEQGLPRMAVADPAACVAAHPVVQGETGTQQRNTQAIGDLDAVGIAHEQLRSVLGRRNFEVFEIADQYARAWQQFEHFRARRGDGGDNLGAHACEQIGHTFQQVRIEPQRNPQEAGHEVRVDHRVLQLAALPLDPGRHRLAGNLGQRLREGVTGVETNQVVEAKSRHAGARFQAIRGVGDGAADGQRGN